MRDRPGPVVVPEEPVSSPTAVTIEPTKDIYPDPMVDAQACYEKGLMAYEQGDRETARDYFYRSLAFLIDAEPDIETLYRLGDLYKKVSSPEPIDRTETQPEVIPETLAVPETADAVQEERVEEQEENSFRIVENDRVRRERDAYCGLLKKAFSEGLARSGKYLPTIRSIIEHEGLPPELAYLPLVESNFKLRARSRVGATGLWQFMPKTAKGCGLVIDRYVDERYDIEKSTYAAVKHLSDLYNLFGSWELALAAYNAGPWKVFEAMLRKYERDFWKLIGTGRHDRVLPRETEAYVPKFMAAVTIAQDPEEYGFQMPVDDAPQAEKVPIEGGVSLDAIARACGVDLTTIRELNPELRLSYTPFRQGEYELKVPAGKREELELALAKMPVTKGVESFRHKVRRGETLSTIAERYGTSIPDIMAANNLRSRHLIRAGQYLVIPTVVATSAPPPAVKTEDGLVYTVKPGDTLWGISNAFGVSVPNLRRWNAGRIRGGDRGLRPGDTILVKASASPQDEPPSAGSRSIKYVVKTGDSLWRVAQKYGINWRAIMERNNLTSTRIDPGDELIIPLK